MNENTKQEAQQTAQSGSTLPYNDSIVEIPLVPSFDNDHDLLVFNRKSTQFHIVKDRPTADNDFTGKCTIIIDGHEYEPAVLYKTLCELLYKD